MGGGEARPAAQGRGPDGRSYAVTIMVAVTRRPPAVLPFLRPAPGPESRRVEGNEEAPRAYRLRGRLRGAQRHGGSAARPPLGAAGAAVGLCGSAGRPAARSLRACQPARQPRPRCHGNRAACGAPDVAGAGESGRPCACAEKPAGRPAARAEVAESRALLEVAGRARRFWSASPAFSRGGSSISWCASHQSRMLVFVRLTLEGTRGLCSVPGCSFWTPGIQKVILPDLYLRLLGSDVAPGQ